MPSVVLYSRPGCHLCDVARQTIEGVRVRLGFDFREVSIEGDDALEREYGIRIPVVLVDGHERFEIAVDADELAKLVNS
jgi:glutaredoxin